MTVARSHKGSAKPTTLAGGISNTATSFVVATGGGTGFPDGSGGVFIVTLDAANASEEKVLCSARAGDTFTVSGGGRGYDDTTAISHGNNASVRHTFSAIEANEANAHILATTGVHGIADTSLLLTTAAGNAAYVVRSEASGAVTATSETTTSLTFADLATVGPTLPITIGPSGRALVIIGATISNSTAGAYAIMAFAVSGATTRAANNAEGPLFTAPAGGNFGQLSHSVFLTGLTPGTNTFTAKYLVSGGTGTFSQRRISVIPL